MVEGKDNIKDLFSEKLTGYEANVRPEMWANISSQIDVTSGATAAGGLSVLAKGIIGISIAASIIGLSIVIVNTSEKKEKQTATETVSEESIVVPEEIEKEVIETPESVITEQIIETVKENNAIPSENVIESNPSDKTIVYIPLPNNRIVNEEKVIDKPVVVKEIKPEIIKENKVDPEIIEERNDISKEEESVVLKDLPNVFTPNGDNVNDFLSIETEGLTDFSIVVLDQKSAIVYKSNEADFIWNGTGMNGDIVPAGNYIYYITARDSKGNLVTRHSTLRIER